MLAYGNDEFAIGTDRYPVGSGELQPHLRRIRARSHSDVILDTALIAIKDGVNSRPEPRVPDATEVPDPRAPFCWIIA